MSNILLINPPFNSYDSRKGVEITFPLGLGYLAATLADAGYTNIEVIDTVAEGQGYFERYKDTNFFSFGLPAEEIKKRIKDLNPSVVGISCAFTKRFENVLDVARIVKEVDSQIKIVVGGAHPSAMPEEVIKHTTIDYVVIGEGEQTFLRLIAYLEKGKGSLKSIDGLAYKEKSEIKLNPKRDYIRDLDSIPFPLREKFPMNLYIKAKRNSIITSRGCSFNCSFCSIHAIWGKQWRVRGPKNVLDEIELLVRDYNVEYISFDDDNLTFDKKRAQDIFQGLVDRKLGVLWNTPNGISVVCLDQQLLKKMKESGCYALNLAIESGDTFILNKVMRKTTSLELVRNVVKWCKELGILTLGYFVIGMPGETKESMMRSFDFAKELMLDVINVFIATPYPGSTLYEECLKKNYLKDSSLVNYTAFDAVFETPTLKAKEVQDFLHYFIDEYTAFHDLYSDISCATFKEAIRRPTKELMESISQSLTAH